MANTDPRFADWMIFEVQVELDREYYYDELAKEVVNRIRNIGVGDAQTHGVYSVKATRLGPEKATFRVSIRHPVWFKQHTSLQDIRTLLYNTIAGIAKDVAEIDRIQSLRRLLPIEPSCTGM